MAIPWSSPRLRAQLSSSPVLGEQDQFSLLQPCARPQGGSPAFLIFLTLIIRPDFFSFFTYFFFPKILKVEDMRYHKLPDNPGVKGAVHTYWPYFNLKSEADLTGDFWGTLLPLQGKTQSDLLFSQLNFYI